MIRQDIDIEGYWKVIFLYNVWLGELNTGFTHSNFHKKQSIIAISPTSSKAQFMNTVLHEIKHLQSHICKYYKVAEDSEDAAYLTGYIAQKIYPVFRELI